MQPATLSPEDAIERLVTVQLEYNLKLFSLSTKARLIRQFGYSVDFHESEFYDDRYPDIGQYTIRRDWFFQHGSLRSHDTFDGEVEAVDAAIQDIREGYADSIVMAVLCEPRKSAKEVLGGMQ